MTGVQTCALPICFPVTITALELAFLREQYQKAGKKDDEIEKILKKKIEADLDMYKKQLDEDYSKDLVSKLMEGERDRRVNGRIPELQKIVDVMYLNLRGYETKIYPPETHLFYKAYLEETAKKIFDCKSTAQVLEVAEKIYEILLNEKGTQNQSDKERMEKIQKEIQQQGQGGQGQGQGQRKKLSKEEIEKLKEKVREKMQKEREERNKKRQQGADVEDFVKNKQKGESGEGKEQGEGKKGEGEGKEGKGEGKEGKGKEGEGNEQGAGQGKGEKKVKFRPGQTVKSLDHDGWGIVSSVSEENGQLVVEVDWETKAA